MFATGLVCGSVEWGKDRKIGRRGDTVLKRGGKEKMGRHGDREMGNAECKNQNKELGCLDQYLS